MSLSTQVWNAPSGSSSGSSPARVTGRRWPPSLIPGALRGLGLSLHPGQEAVARSEARFRVVIAGRRWGKDTLAAHLAVLEAALGARCWYVAPTYDLCDAGYDLAWMLAAREGLIAPRSSRAERRLFTPAGGMVAGKSADNPDSLLGRGLDFVVFSEAPKCSAKIWHQFLRPALSDRGGHALLIGTAEGRNWAYDLYKWGQDGVEGWYSRASPSWENAHQFPGGRDDPEIAAAFAEYERAGLLPLWWQEYGADFAQLQGRVFQAWRPDTMLQPRASLVAGVKQWYGGVDWGYINPTAFVVGGFTETGAARIVEEWQAAGQTQEQVIGALLAATQRWSVQHWYADTSEPRMIAACRAAGLSMSGASKDVSPGILAVAEAMGRPGFGVAVECPQLARQIENYHRADHSAKTDPKETPVKKDAHLVDAVRYWIFSRKSMGSVAPQPARVVFPVHRTRRYGR